MTEVVDCVFIVVLEVETRQEFKQIKSEGKSGNKNEELTRTVNMEFILP